MNMKVVYIFWEVMINSYGYYVKIVVLICDNWDLEKKKKVNMNCFKMTIKMIELKILIMHYFDKWDHLG